MTNVSTGVLADLGYELESAFGVLNSVPALTKIRHVRSSINLVKETYKSEEKRTDRSTYDLRHGVRSVEGTIEGELAVASWDDFLEALMGGIWTTGASKSNTEFTSLAATASTKTFTVGGGNLITEGLRVGDRIVLGTCAAAGPYTILTIPTNTTFTVAEAVIGGDMGADTSFTLVVTGKKLAIGNTYRSFTIERAFTDISEYIAYLGCRVDSLDLQMAPTGIVKSNFGIMGLSASAVSGSTVDAAAGYTAAPTHSVLASVDGVLYEGGTALGIATNLTLSVKNGIGGKAVIGSNTKQALLWGDAAEITGELTVLFSDATAYNKFVNETESNLICRLVDPNGTDFMQMTLTRIKYTGGIIGDADPQGNPVTLPFTCLIPAAATSSKSDVSPVVFQRSN